eukprot:UN00408
MSTVILYLLGIRGLLQCYEIANFKRTDNCESCVINHCLNGGICINGDSDYTCKCPPDYTGKRCESNICDRVGSMDMALGNLDTSQSSSHITLPYQTNEEINPWWKISLGDSHDIGKP